MEDMFAFADDNFIPRLNCSLGTLINKTEQALGAIYGVRTNRRISAKVIKVEFAKNVTSSIWPRLF
jgi:hypothetical protein